MEYIDGSTHQGLISDIAPSFRLHAATTTKEMHQSGLRSKAIDVANELSSHFAEVRQAQEVMATRWKLVDMTRSMSSRLECLQNSNHFRQNLSDRIKYSGSLQRRNFSNDARLTSGVHRLTAHALQVHVRRRDSRHVDCK